MTSSDQLDKYSVFMFFPPLLPAQIRGLLCCAPPAKRSHAWIPKHPTSHVLTRAALGCENCRDLTPRPQHFFRIGYESARLVTCATRVQHWRLIA